MTEQHLSRLFRFRWLRLPCPSDTKLLGGLLLTAALPLTATVVPAEAAAGPVLTVRIHGNGSINELTDAHRMNCSANGGYAETSTYTCTATYGTGWIVELKSAAPSGWVFHHWGDKPGVSGWVDCDNNTATDRCKFQIWQDLQLDAYFDDVTSPNTSIAPSPATTGTWATFSYSSNELGSSFRCKLDGLPEETCVSSRTYTGLAGGYHQFGVRAIDPSGNGGAMTYRNWFVDAVAPQTTIASGPSAYTAQSAAQFTATATESASYQCSLDGGVFHPCSPSYAVSGLAAGQHMVRMRATDAYGNTDPTSATWTWTIGQAGPTASMLKAGNSPLVRSTRIPLAWAGSDNAAGVADYEARYRHAAFNGGWTAYTSPPRTTTTGTTFNAAPGFTYCFSVRAADRVGNHGAWSSERCTTTPVDDRIMRGTGWVNRLNRSDYLGTVKTTTTFGRTLTLPYVQGTQLALVATTCPSCGAVDVYLGSWRVGRVSLASTTTRHAVVKPLPAFAHLNAGRLTLKVVSGNRYVAIDGVSVRR